MKEDGRTNDEISMEFFDKFDESPSHSSIKAAISRYLYGERRGAHTKSCSSTKTTRFKQPKPTNFSVSLMDIGYGQCRYTQDTGVDMKLCGEPVYKSHSFCKECCEVAYTSLDRKRSTHVKPLGLKVNTPAKSQGM